MLEVEQGKKNVEVGDVVLSLMAASKDPDVVKMREERVTSMKNKAAVTHLSNQNALIQTQVKQMRLMMGKQQMLLRSVKAG